MSESGELALVLSGYGLTGRGLDDKMTTAAGLAAHQSTTGLIVDTCRGAASVSVPPYTLDPTIIGTSSFGSTKFFLVQYGGTISSKRLPRFGSKALIVKRHIPGGDRNVIQQLGRQTDPLQIEILIRLEDRATLVGQVNTSNTLTIKYGSPQQALLTAVDAPRDFAEGFALCSVTFELLG